MYSHDTVIVTHTYSYSTAIFTPESGHALLRGTVLLVGRLFLLIRARSLITSCTAKIEPATNGINQLALQQKAITG